METPEPAPVSFRTLLLLSCGTALLLWMSYFPLAWGWTALVALVPLLFLVRLQGRRPRLIYLAAWIGGLVFYWSALQWIRVADYRMYASWATLSTYCSCYFPLTVYLLRKLDGRVPLIVCLPATWVGFEYIRTHLMTGFAWYYLGHSQHDYLHIVQIADLGGAYAVSFVVALVNAVVFEIVFRMKPIRAWLGLPDAAVSGRLGWQIAVAVIALGGTVSYGAWRLGESRFTPGPRVSLLQGNVDQRIRNAAMSQKEPGESMYGELKRLADAAAKEPRPDLIVWPETSFPGVWTINPDGSLIEYSEEIRQIMKKRWPIATLAGIDVFENTTDDESRKYNSAVLVGHDGSFLGRYDKIHRVPFGEYVPLLDWLPFMARFAPYNTPYSIHIGKGLTDFPLGEYRFGVLICYEDSDAQLSRGYGREEHGQRPVDFIVNISNDGWFDGTNEHDEHLAICRFRAIESRRSVIRAVNMGISAIIDSNGRVLAPKGSLRFEDPKIPPVQFWEVPSDAVDLPLSRWHEYKKVAGVLTGSVPIDRRPSFYAQWGDWLPWLCLGVLGMALVVAFWGPGPRSANPT